MARPDQPEGVGPPLGDLGTAPIEEMLVDGQEEVFARSEFEQGAVEHKVTAGEREETKE